MSKHTPGPWMVDPAEDSPLGIVDNNGDGICEIGTEGSVKRDSTPYQDANAHLIAAAPDMYQALSDALAWLGTLEDLTENEKDAIGSMAAALAKADGETS